MERLEKARFGIARLWRNSSTRRLALLMAIAMSLTIVLLWLYSVYSAEQLKKEWLDKEAAMIGTLSARHPELAEQWSQLLIQADTLDAGTMEKSRQWMEQHGITPQLEARFLPTLKDYQARTLWTLLGGAVLMFVIITLFLLWESRRQLSEIRRLAVALDDTVKHNLPMAFRIYGEGELGLLANGVQELSLRLRETIEQLHQDKTFLKETVADISHQLKTPLSSLMIYVDLLQEGQVDAEHVAEFLDTCKRELDRMEWLTLTLLKIARIEADALEMSLKTTPLKETVHRAMEMIRRLADDKQVAIVVDGSDSHLKIPHDSRWLAEAIANVLKNAVEHSPTGSEITISWEQTPVFIRLLIKDQGCGIEEQHLPHIFKKFYRISASSHGVGLGLPLSKSIVERHGGMLSAAASPEDGTQFSFTFPLRPLPAEPAFLTNL